MWIFKNSLLGRGVNRKEREGEGVERERKIDEYPCVLVP
jgi:hypothetical protein